MAIQDDITWRTVIVYAVIVLFGCLIVGKAVVVMTVEGKKWRSKAAASEPARLLLFRLTGGIFVRMTDVF